MTLLRNESAIRSSTTVYLLFLCLYCGKKVDSSVLDFLSSVSRISFASDCNGSSKPQWSQHTSVTELGMVSILNHCKI